MKKPIRLLLSALLMLVGFGLQAQAQEVDDLQEYLDKLAAEQTQQARQKTIQKDGEIDIPVGLAEVDLTKFTSYANRKTELSIKASVKFTNGTITASSDFSGTSLLKVYGGATVALDKTAGIDASAATPNACAQAVGIYGSSSFYQEGDIIAAGRADGVAIFLSSADDAYYYISGLLVGTINNPYNGKVEGIEDVAGKVKKLQERMSTFSSAIDALQTRVISVKTIMAEMTTGKEFFMRKASADFTSALSTLTNHLDVNQTYITGLINEFNEYFNGLAISTMAEAQEAEEKLKSLEDRIPVADNDLSETEAEAKVVRQKYDTLDVNFPDADQVYSLVPNTGVSRNDIQMGYKDLRGFVLTSAGMMFFEQVNRADFHLRDQNGNYVVVKSGSARLTAGTKEEAAVFTGYNIGNGMFRFYHKNSNQYLSCSGSKVNAEMLLSTAMEWKIIASDLDDLQAFLNLLAEEEEEEQGGGSGLTENDIITVYVPTVPCNDCNKVPWIFPRIPSPIRLLPAKGENYLPIPNPNPGQIRPSDFRPIQIPKGSHVIIDDVTIMDLIGGGEVIYVEGTLEINVKVIVNIVNWTWFIHVGPSGRVIWRPGRGVDPNWIAPRIKIDTGGTVEIVDDGYLGHIENTGTIIQTGGTVETVINRTTYKFSGGLINFMDNYGTQTQTGGTVWKVVNQEGSTYNMEGGEIINKEENTKDIVFTNYGTFYFKGGILGGYGSRLIYHGPKGVLRLDGGRFDFTHIIHYFIEAHNVFYIRGDYEIPLPFLLNPSVSVHILYKWIYKWKFEFIGGRPTVRFPLFYGDGDFKLIKDYFTLIDWTLPNRWRWHLNPTNNTIEPRDEQVEDEDDLQAYLDWLAANQDGEAASTEEEPQELDLAGKQIVITRIINIPANVHIRFINCVFRPAGLWNAENVFVIPSGSSVRYEKVVFDFSSSGYYWTGSQYVQVNIFNIAGKVWLEDGCHLKGFVNTQGVPTDTYIPGAVVKVDPATGHLWLNSGQIENVVFCVNNVFNIWLSTSLSGKMWLYIPTAYQKEGFQVFQPYGDYKFTAADIRNMNVFGTVQWRVELDKEGFVVLYDFLARYDVNGDGSVNAADIVEIVNYIMGHPSEKFNADAADPICDGAINAADIVMLVNVIMGII